VQTKVFTVFIRRYLHSIADRLNQAVLVSSSA
jgi:hypothetical protein